MTENENVKVGDSFVKGELVLWPILVNSLIILIYIIHITICILFYEKNFFDISKETIQTFNFVNLPIKIH